MVGCPILKRSIKCACSLHLSHLIQSGIFSPQSDEITDLSIHSRVHVSKWSNRRQASLARGLVSGERGNMVTGVHADYHSLLKGHQFSVVF